MERIGLIDVDFKNFPNIALMKISAWHKKRGDMVEFYSPWSNRYDIVYISKIFSNSPDYDLVVNADKVIRGGTGFAITNQNGKEVYRKELDPDLLPEIEHIFPDYSLYPQFTRETAFGFLTRGCPRGCSFCIVGGKEGLKSHKVADLSEFWNGQKNIVLCDPNFLAASEWRDLAEQLIKSNATVDFNQGLDIRLMTEEKAHILNKIKMRDIHFAWDRYQDKNQVLPKLKLFADVCHIKKNNHNCIVYTLVNYDTTFGEDLERIYTLRDLGFWPYVMIYDKPNADRLYYKLQRWVNNRFVFAKCQNFNDYGNKAESG